MDKQNVVRITQLLKRRHHEFTGTNPERLGKDKGSTGRFIISLERESRIDFMRVLGVGKGWQWG